jgi:hypothetical protein
MSKHAEEITGSTRGRGVALTIPVQVFEDGHGRFDRIPCGEPGTDGWNSLHEHVTLRLGELRRELGRLKDGRRLLPRATPSVSRPRSDASGRSNCER